MALSAGKVAGLNEMPRCLKQSKKMNIPDKNQK